MANPRAPQGPAHPELHQSGKRKGKAYPRPRPPFFGNALTLGVRSPGKLQLCTVRVASLRVYLRSALVPRHPPDGPAVPVLASFAVARGPISALDLRSQPGTLADSRGRGSFHSSQLSSAFRAGLTPGWAEPRACSERGEAGAS